MGRCAGIRADGGRCAAQAIRDSQWCFSHHPDLAEERRRSASRGGKRGGRGRGGGEIADLKKRLEDLAADVLSGALETSRGAVVNQILNTRLRAVELERKIREQEVIEERIAALERAREGSQRWRPA
jgi:hypothetical protein